MAETDELAEPVDVIGELLFGRRLRLRVLLWVSDQAHPFNQSEAARGVQYNSSGEVAKELERLAELKMLRKFGRPTRVGPQNYKIVEDHPGWAIAKVARTMAEALVSGTPEQDSDQPCDVVDASVRLHSTGGPGNDRHFT
jgi:hypothetical protein